MVKEKLLGLFRIYLVCVAGLVIIMVGIALSRHPFVPIRGFTALMPLLFGGIGAVVLFVIFVWIGVGVAVYHDAKQRGMEPLLWALVAMLVPYLLGLIAYLIVRHPLQSLCTSCRQPVSANDVYCKSCGVSLQVHCPACGRPSLPAARFCPHCGAPMGERPATAPTHIP